MAEWSIAAVLKTVEGNTSGGSNPSLSAQKSRKESPYGSFFVFEVKNDALSAHSKTPVFRHIDCITPFTGNDACTGRLAARY